MRFSFKKTISKDYITEGQTPISEWSKRRKEYERKRNIPQFCRDIIRKTFRRIIRKLKDIKLEIKWGFQRMFRGYDDRLFWNTDSYISVEILEVLRFHKNKDYGGMPLLTNEERRKHFKGDLSDKRVKQRNEERLDVMIEGFQILKNVDPIDRTEEQQVKADKSLKMLAKYFEYLWD